MPKKYRLTGDEMKRIRGRRLHGALFSLVMSPLPDGCAKAAVVVSKKVAASAVVRNGIERKMRAILYGRIPKLTTPVALVFQAKKEVLDASFTEIERDIEKLIASSQARS